MTVENGLGNVLLRDVYYAMWYGDPIEHFRGATPRMAYSIIAVSLVCLCCASAVRIYEPLSGFLYNPVAYVTTHLYIIPVMH